MNRPTCLPISRALDELVRGEALEVLAARNPPELVRPQIEWTAKNDASAEIRRVANEILVALEARQAG